VVMEPQILAAAVVVRATGLPRLTAAMVDQESLLLDINSNRGIS